MSRSPGPLCQRCACERHMHMPMPPTYDWREVHGECLVCSDCREYEPSQDEDTRTVEALP